MFVYLETFRPIEVHVQVAQPSVEGLKQHIAYTTARMRDRGRSPGQDLVYVIQHHRRGFRQTNAVERKLLADWMKTEADLMKATSLGISFVLESSLVRGALTAVFWLTSTPVPYRVHSTLDDALITAIRAVKARGLSVSAALENGGPGFLQAQLNAVGQGHQAGT